MRGTRGSGAFGRINGYLPAAAAAVAAVAAAAATRKRRMMIRTVDSAKTGEERKEGSRSKVIAPVFESETRGRKEWTSGGS